MVQTDISQLSAEASEWRQILRNYRDEFGDYKKLLEDTIQKDLSKDQLREVEHFDNQFHIQLVNIHDVKQHIKGHERKVKFELSNGEQLSEDIYAEHERLLDEFISLESTLQTLRDDFRNFVNATQS